MKKETKEDRRGSLNKCPARMKEPSKEKRAKQRLKRILLPKDWRHFLNVRKVSKTAKRDVMDRTHPMIETVLRAKIIWDVFEVRHQKS